MFFVAIINLLKDPWLWVLPIARVVVREIVSFLPSWISMWQYILNVNFSLTLIIYQIKLWYGFLSIIPKIRQLYPQLTSFVKICYLKCELLTSHLYNLVLYTQKFYYKWIFNLTINPENIICYYPSYYLFWINNIINQVLQSNELFSFSIS